MCPHRRSPRSNHRKTDHDQTMNSRWTASPDECVRSNSFTHGTSGSKAKCNARVTIMSPLETFRARASGACWLNMHAGGRLRHQRMTHPKSAFIYATVHGRSDLRGARSTYGPVRTYRAGESLLSNFLATVDSVSANASAAEPARYALAVFVVDTEETVLTHSLRAVN